MKTRTLRSYLCFTLLATAFLLGLAGCDKEESEPLRIGDDSFNNIENGVWTAYYPNTNQTSITIYGGVKPYTVSSNSYLTQSRRCRPQPDTGRLCIHYRSLVEPGSRITGHRPSPPYRTKQSGDCLPFYHSRQHRGENYTTARRKAQTGRNLYYRYRAASGTNQPRVGPTFRIIAFFPLLIRPVLSYIQDQKTALTTCMVYTLSTSG